MKRNGKEGKKNEREIALICIGGNKRKKREIRVFPLNFSNFEEIETLTTKYPSNPFNLLPFKLLSSYFAIQIKDFFFP